MSAIALPESPPNPVLAMIEKAIDKGVDADQLTKLIELSERIERNAAARIYSDAIADFKSEVSPILKTKLATIGTKYSYTYASFNDVTAVIDPVLSKFRITYSFDTNPDPMPPIVPPPAEPVFFMRIIVKLRCGIHVEKYHFDMPVPPDANGNGTQLYASALTYARRYGLVSALGLTVTDTDTDAQGLIKSVSKEQVADLKARCAKANANIPMFLQYCQAESFETIPASFYGKAVAALAVKGVQK